MKLLGRVLIAFGVYLVVYQLGYTLVLGYGLAYVAWLLTLLGIGAVFAGEAILRRSKQSIKAVHVGSTPVPAIQSEPPKEEEAPEAMLAAAYTDAMEGNFDLAVEMCRRIIGKFPNTRESNISLKYLMSRDTADLAP